MKLAFGCSSVKILVFVFSLKGACSFKMLKLQLSIRWCNIYLGPVHTYPDIFESATFSFRMRKYPRPHAMWSQRIHIEFARSHVFGFTPYSPRINKIVPPGTGSSRSGPESSRTALLSYSFKLFLSLQGLVVQRVNSALHPIKHCVIKINWIFQWK